MLFFGCWWTQVSPGNCWCRSNCFEDWSHVRVGGSSSSSVAMQPFLGVSEEVIKLFFGHQSSCYRAVFRELFFLWIVHKINSSKTLRLEARERKKKRPRNFWKFRLRFKVFYIEAKNLLKHFFRISQFSAALYILPTSHFFADHLFIGIAAAAFKSLFPKPFPLSFYNFLIDKFSLRARCWPLRVFLQPYVIAGKNIIRPKLPF